MSVPRIVFFGSFQNYSALILEQLTVSPELKIVGVVTTPPQPETRKKKSTPNPTQVVAEAHQLPIYTPEILTDPELSNLTTDLGPVDYFLTAGYGKLLPNTWLQAPNLGALNLHFSLLPKFRGANPAEWALLFDEKEIGVTLIEMSPEFDTGTMIAQAALTIESTDTRETLYQKLYTLGGHVLPEMVSVYHSFRTNTPRAQTLNQLTLTASSLAFTLPPVSQPTSTTPYAKKLSREDGFIAWAGVTQLMKGQPAELSTLSPTLQEILTHLHQPLNAHFVERATRALADFPSLWTMIPTSKGEKRMQLISATVEGSSKLVLEKVKIEGQSIAQWNQVKNVVI